MNQMTRRYLIVGAVTALLTVTVLLLPAPTVAETPQGTWGVFAGVNLGNMGGDMDAFGDGLAREIEASQGGIWTVDKGIRSGLALGVSYTVMLQPSWGMQFEALYVRRGVNFDLEDDSGTTAATAFKLDYVEFPILMRFAPGRSSGFQPVFLAGPVVALNIGANVLVTNGGENTAFNVGDSIESAAVGLVAGVGFRSQLGESAMLVQVRYHLGLTDVLRTPEDPLETDYSGTPADIMVLVGVEFGVN